MRKLHLFIALVLLVSACSREKNINKQVSFEEMFEVSLNSLSPTTSMVIPPLSSSDDTPEIILVDHDKLTSAMSNLGWKIDIDGEIPFSSSDDSSNGRVSSGSGLSASQALGCVKDILAAGGCAYVGKTGSGYTVKQIPCE